MRILSVTAYEFGLFKNRQFLFDEGITLIEGENESGKSTLQALIVFLLYGFGRRAQEERSLRLSHDGHRAAGEMRLVRQGTTYILRREYLLRSLAGRVAPLETCEVTDAAGHPIDLAGKQPGELFLGIPRELYEACASVRQSEIAAVTDAATGDAVSRLLFLDAGGAGFERASRLLNAARRELQHSKGQGGLLGELAEEREMLTEAAREAAERNGRLADLRNQVTGVTEGLQQRERSLAELASAERAGEIDGLLARLAALRAAEEESARLEAALRECEREGKDAALPAEALLAEAEKRADTLLRLTGERDALLARADAAAAVRVAAEGNAQYRKIEELGGVGQLSDRLARLQGGRGVLLLLSVCLSVLAAGAFALLSVPALSGASLPLLGGIFATAALAAAIGFLLVRKRLRTLCAAFGLRTPQLLPALLAAHRAAEQDVKTAAKGEAEYLARAEALAGELSLCRAEWSRLAARLGLPADTAPAALLGRAAALVGAGGGLSDERTRALQAALGAASAKREMLAAALTGLDEQALLDERKRLGAVPPVSPDEAAARRRALEAEKAALAARHIELLREEAALVVGTADTAALQALLAENAARTEQAAARLAAIQLAQTALAEADGALRDGILPRVTEGASALLPRLTGGRYRALRLAADFSVSLETKDGFFPLSHFSAGCRDAVGLALRLSLIRLMTAEPLPLLLDEVTARLDDTRTAELLALLANLSDEDAQVLLFTCHTREGTLLSARHVPYLKISLGRESGAYS